MADQTAENLRRLMATLGLTLDQVVQRTGLDRRTIQGILDGSNRPQPRTLHRLAQGLNVEVDEFFLDPAQLLYRQFDRQTNPVVDEVVKTYPELFTEWTAADFDELHSRVGTGGPLTVEGALAAVRAMNENREAHEQLSVLLESSQAQLARTLLRALYEQVTDPNSQGGIRKAEDRRQKAEFGRRKAESRFRKAEFGKGKAEEDGP